MNVINLDVPTAEKGLGVMNPRRAITAGGQKDKYIASIISLSPYRGYGERGSIVVNAITAPTPRERRSTGSFSFATTVTMSSLNNSLKKSAMGCRRPKGPTYLGPTRFCILA